jgi:glucan phosphoethanolaminetransferase (alkaline phosphatase superfamily)
LNRWIGIGLGIITLIVIAFLVAAAIFPAFREASRDIAIIILAVFQMVSAIITIVLLLALLYVAQQIHRVALTTVIPKIDALTVKVDEVVDQTRAIAGNAKETAVTVSSTTSYVSEQVVTPFIRISSLVAGVRAAAAFLARRDDPS